MNYDIVYPLKKINASSYWELRYSFRSLENLPHNNVWLLGAKPHWSQNICYLDIDEKKRGQLSVIDKLHKICLQDSLSEDFILMNDDFFVLQKIQKITNYHFGTLNEYININKKLNYAKGYVLSAVRTLAMLNNKPSIKNFSLHVPFMFNKRKLKELLDKTDLSLPFHLRTLYANHYNISSIERQDSKVFNFKIDWNKDFLSTSKIVENNALFRSQLQNKFPNKSIYEH